MVQLKFRSLRGTVSYLLAVLLVLSMCIPSMGLEVYADKFDSDGYSVELDGNTITFKALVGDDEKKFEYKGNRLMELGVSVFFDDSLPLYDRDYMVSITTSEDLKDFKYSGSMYNGLTHPEFELKFGEVNNLDTLNALLSYVGVGEVKEADNSSGGGVIDDGDTSVPTPPVVDDGIVDESGTNADGTKSRPFVLSTVADLQALKDAPTSGVLHYLLANDLDLTGVTWETIEDFNGVLDGKGHSIKNLTIQSGSEAFFMRRVGTGSEIKNVTFTGILLDSVNNASLFSSVNGAKLLNLGIEGVINSDNPNGISALMNNVIFEGNNIDLKVNGKGSVSGISASADNITFAGNTINMSLTSDHVSGLFGSLRFSSLTGNKSNLVLDGNSVAGLTNYATEVELVDNDFKVHYVDIGIGGLIAYIDKSTVRDLSLDYSYEKVNGSDTGISLLYGVYNYMGSTNLNGSTVKFTADIDDVIEASGLTFVGFGMTTHEDTTLENVSVNGSANFKKVIGADESEIDAYGFVRGMYNDGTNKTSFARGITTDVEFTSNKGVSSVDLHGVFGNVEDVAVSDVNTNTDIVLTGLENKNSYPTAEISGFARYAGRGSIKDATVKSRLKIHDVDSDALTLKVSGVALMNNTDISDIDADVGISVTNTNVNYAQIGKLSSSSNGGRMSNVNVTGDIETSNFESDTLLLGGLVGSMSGSGNTGAPNFSNISSTGVMGLNDLSSDILEIGGMFGSSSYSNLFDTHVDEKITVNDLSVTGYGNIGAYSGTLGAVRVGKSSTLGSLNVKGASSGTNVQVGGFSGLLGGTDVMTSYTQTPITAENVTVVGGFTGNLGGSNMEQSYAYGLIDTKSVDTVGSLVGLPSSGSTITSSYFNKDNVGIDALGDTTETPTVVDDLKGLTTEEFKSETNFESSHWSFARGTGTWIMSAIAPVFVGQYVVTGKVTVVHKDLDGNVLDTEVFSKVPLGANTYNSKQLTGYTLVGDATKSVTVTDTDTTHEVVFTYDKVKAVAGEVTELHTDVTSGEVLNKVVHSNMALGSHTFKSKSFQGYSLVGVDEKVVMLTSTDMVKTVEFKYKKNTTGGGGVTEPKPPEKPVKPDTGGDKGDGGIVDACPKLTIPNTKSPNNHGLSVAILKAKKDVVLYKRSKDGKFIETVKAKEGLYYPILDTVDCHYKLSGDLYAPANSGTVHIGKGEVRIDSVNVYNKDGKVVRKLKRGQEYKVYSYDDKRYAIGNGEFVPKMDGITFVFGWFVVEKKMNLVDKKGNLVRVLNKGEKYRIYSIDKDMLRLGGEMRVKLDRDKITFIKN